jgi:hypothetical protein
MLGYGKLCFPPARARTLPSSVLGDMSKDESEDIERMILASTILLTVESPEGLSHTCPYKVLHSLPLPPRDDNDEEADLARAIEASKLDLSPATSITSLSSDPGHAPAFCRYRTV